MSSVVPIRAQFVPGTYPAPLYYRVDNWGNSFDTRTGKQLKGSEVNARWDAVGDVPPLPLIPSLARLVPGSYLPPLGYTVDSGFRAYDSRTGMQLSQGEVDARWYEAAGQAQPIPASLPSPTPTYPTYPASAIPAQLPAQPAAEEASLDLSGNNQWMLLAGAAALAYLVAGQGRR
jgi:hypothetical protein